jgi:hypothetical protein
MIHDLPTGAMSHRLDLLGGLDSLGVDVGRHSRLVRAHSQRPVQEPSVT